MESNNSGGDVDGAIRDADHVFRHRYEMPAVNHCSLETHVSIAEYDADGKLTVWTLPRMPLARESICSVFSSCP